MGVPIGLKDIYVSKLLSDLIAGTNYDTPVKLAKAIEATITPQVNTATLFADDGPVDQLNTLGAIQVAIGVDQLTNAQKSLLLGHEIDANGVLVGKNTDEAPYVALGFKSLMSNGSYKFVWLYKGKFQLNEESFATKKDSAEFKTPTLNSVFIRRAFDNAWKAEANEDDTSVPSTVFSNWFNTVYLPDVTQTALTVSTNIVDNSVDNTVDTTFEWIFSNTLDPDCISKANFILMTAPGEIVDSTLTSGVSGNGTKVTLTPESSLTNSGEYVAIATTNIKDTAGNVLSAANIVNFTVIA